MITLTLLGMGCLVAATLIVTAGVLSSKINRSQPITEKYETHTTLKTTQGFTPRTYPIEINA